MGDDVKKLFFFVALLSALFFVACGSDDTADSGDSVDDSGDTSDTTTDVGDSTTDAGDTTDDSADTTTDEADTSDSGSDDVYSKKVRDLQMVNNPNTGEPYTFDEAVIAVNTGASGMLIDKKSSINQTSSTIGNIITTSGDYSTGGGMSNESLKSESDFMAGGGGKQKERTDFKAKTSGVTTVMNTTNEIRKGIDDGTLNFSVTETFKNTIMKNTPQEIVDEVKQYIKLDDDDFAKRIGVDGKLGLMIAKMTKEYFGGHASDADKQTFIDAFGFGTWTNNQTVQAKMKGMQDIILSGYKKDADLMINSGYTYSTSQQYLSMVKPYVKGKSKTKVDTKVTKDLVKSWKYGAPEPEGYKVQVKRDSNGKVTASRLVKIKG